MVEEVTHTGRQINDPEVVKNIQAHNNREAVLGALREGMIDKEKALEILPDEPPTYDTLFRLLGEGAVKIWNALKGKK